MEQLSPIEIARQTLLQLAARKIPPTPDNYRMVFDEISGTQSADAASEINKSIKKVLLEAGKFQPKYIASAQAISAAIEKSEWGKLEDSLQKIIGNPSKEGGPPNWAAIIRNLLKQLEISHKGVTLSRKKEGLSRVFSNFENDEAQLAQKIQALVNSWGVGTQAETPELPEVIPAATGAVNAMVSVEAEAPQQEVIQAPQLLIRHFREMLLKTFELVLIPQLEVNPEAASKARTLVQKLALASSEDEVSKQSPALKSTLITLEIQRDNQQKIMEALMNLLRLTIESMSELVVDDKWLHGQTAIISDIISKPVNISTLYDAESSLKDFIYKQHNIKPALMEAKDTLKQMATTFVLRLAEVSESTTDYQAKIEQYQEQIASTEDIIELNSLLKSVLEDTRAMGLSVQRTRDMLEENQKRAAEAEATVAKLTAELDYISAVAHEDYLTGALNRRGMDEALEREFSRADRHQAPISLAMMDIDHFKKLNDTHGHATGDTALQHLAKIVRSVLRTTDVIARFGGEEFLIILPGTSLEDGILIMTRTQRELTKNYFLHNNERLLITFSAGVAERRPGEDMQSLIERADGALYTAKNSGRNRVIGAD